MDQSRVFQELVPSKLALLLEPSMCPALAGLTLPKEMVELDLRRADPEADSGPQQEDLAADSVLRSADLEAVSERQLEVLAADSEPRPADLEADLEPRLVVPEVDLELRLVVPVAGSELQQVDLAADSELRPADLEVDLEQRPADLEVVQLVGSEEEEAVCSAWPRTCAGRRTSMGPTPSTFSSSGSSVPLKLNASLTQVISCVLLLELEDQELHLSLQLHPSPPFQLCLLLPSPTLQLCLLHPSPPLLLFLPPLLLCPVCPWRPAPSPSEPRAHTSRSSGFSLRVRALARFVALPHSLPRLVQPSPLLGLLHRPLGLLHRPLGLLHRQLGLFHRPLGQLHHPLGLLRCLPVQWFRCRACLYLSAWNLLELKVRTLLSLVLSPCVRFIQI